MPVSQQSTSRGRAVVGTVLTALSLLAASLTTGVITATPAYALPCEGHNNIPGSVPASDYYPAYSRTAADVNKPITPDEALARAVDWEVDSPTYCQEDPYPDRHGRMYRADCSGFVSMAWHIDQPLTTLSLPSVSEQISISEVQPGDALINAGHTELVWSVENDMIETIGFGSTPVDHWGPVPMWVADMLYDAYRYNNMQVVTDEMIRELIRENAPRPEPNIEPRGNQSIVNWETLFHINPDADDDADTTWEAVVSTGVGNLQVRLRATATNFHWNFASPDREGEPETAPATQDTEYPGAPYGQEGDQVVHKYMSTDVFHPSVDITWTNYQYQIVGEEADGWNDVDGEHVGDGPEIALTILQFSSVLTR